MRETRLEKFVNDYSYEEITDLEANFILELYDAIRILVDNGDKVSLIRLSGMVKVSPSELTDYLSVIVSIEKLLEDGSV